MDDETLRWRTDVERRLLTLEQELHGKNGLTQLVSGMNSKLTWIGAVAGSLLVTILAGVVAQIVS
jgi:hypothetical protein